eukprot:scaffold14386_cov42-Phaeocystis_antarctica.AAC.1
MLCGEHAQCAVCSVRVRGCVSRAAAPFSAARSSHSSMAAAQSVEPSTSSDSRIDGGARRAAPRKRTVAGLSAASRQQPRQRSRLRAQSSAGQRRAA